ncbi:hypothetical protein R1sor_022270 [Riccia sorocarpa]|uniref:Uncharacterized protein n=1 Tax=Riccia sorocarpa TaxID=122646 RepID=A0ABD3GNL9_9MARC
MGFLSSTVVTLLLCLAAFVVLSAHAADPEEIRDFAPPPPGTTLDAHYFTSTKLRNIDDQQKQADRESVCIVQQHECGTGLPSLPRTVFGVNIDIEVLTKSFEVSPYIIKTLSAQQP